MAELSDWDVSAAGNDFTAPDGFPEGMQFSDVNNSAREIMAVLAREYADRNGSLVSTGSGGTYALTSNRTLGAYANGQTFKFRANHTNAGASTISVGGLGAKAICRPDGSAIIAGAIQSGGIYEISYSSVLDKFVLFGGFGLDMTQVSQATTSAAGKTELATDAETITGTDTARVPPVSALTALFNAAGRASHVSAGGYQKLPGGLIIQWGRKAQGDFSSGTTVSVTFPTTFASACFVVIPVLDAANGGTNPNGFPGVLTRGVGGFTANLYEYTGTVQNVELSYIAIGV